MSDKVWKFTFKCVAIVRLKGRPLTRTKYRITNLAHDRSDAVMRAREAVKFFAVKPLERAYLVGIDNFHQITVTTRYLDERVSRRPISNAQLRTEKAKVEVIF